MLCLRCRAVPSLRTPMSTIRTPMNRLSQFTPQPSATSIQPSRPFSSLLSTPARLQPTQFLSSRLPSTSTPTTLSQSVSSLLSQNAESQAQVGQTRSFSATASLGVRRATFRPSRRVQKRRHGFLARNTARKGRLTLTRRRLKGRKAMSW